MVIVKPTLPSPPPIRPVPPTDMLCSRQSYEGRASMNSSYRANRSAKSYENYKYLDSETKGIQFGVDDESDVCSPPLWNNYGQLSPVAKAQAIARGQRELMDMVKNMPESCYELSLKDLVEHPKPTQEIVRREADLSTIGEGWRRGDNKTARTRSRSLGDGGFLLKMVFPLSFGSKSRKKARSTGNTCPKVSPKPQVSVGSAKNVEKEWWNRRLSALGDGEGRESCGGSSTRHGRGSSSNCWSFYFKKNTLPCFD